MLTVLLFVVNNEISHRRAKDDAEARTRVEEDRAARIALERRLADRVISDDQVAGLTERMKPYAGIKVAVSFPNAHEPIAVAIQLRNALHKAGWVA